VQLLLEILLLVVELFDESLDAERGRSAHKGWR
jgi:hypothetical protein